MYQGLGWGIGLPLRSSLPRPLRCVPGGTDTFYVLTPSAWGTALAHRLQRNIFTTMSSLGYPAQPWRRTASGEIATLQSDPASPLFAITPVSTTGALDYALQNNPAGFIFGGSFHGGETNINEQLYADGAPFDPQTTPVEAGVIRLERMTGIDWGSGRTMTVTYALQFNADGTVFEQADFTSTSAFAQQTIGMDIFTLDFGERTAGGVTVSTTLDSDVASGADDITYRAPASGHTARLVSDIPSAVRYQKTTTDNQGVQVKHYPYLASTAGGPFGMVGYQRTISYAKGAPDPFYWSAPRNLTGGWSVPTGFNLAGVAIEGVPPTPPQLVFRRANGIGTTRVVWPVTGLTIGQSYTLKTVIQITGSSPSGGTVLSISVNANGTSATTLANASNGTPSFAISGALVTQTTMYLCFNQTTASGSDNVLKLSELKIV